MLHDVRTDQATRSSKARFAMHRNCTGRRLAYRQEFSQNLIRRCAAINEIQITMIEAGTDKT